MKKVLCTLLIICMVAGMLTGAVSAADPKQAFVRFNCIDYAKNDIIRVDALVNEGETMYFLTNDDGLAYKDGASASNYNIKFEYPKGGTPTLYLKNANLIGQFDTPISVGRSKDDKTGVTEIRNFDFILYVEAESTVHSLIKDASKDICGPSAIAFNNRGLTTITGPGKLNAIGDTNNGIVKGGGDLLIKNATINAQALIPHAWGTRHPIWCNNGAITVENSTLDLYSVAGGCIWSSEEYKERYGEKHDITLKNSTIKCVSDRHSTEFGIISTMGKIYIDNCDVELISTSANGGPLRCFAPKPVLSNVTAIAGKTQEKATEYNEKKYTTHYYFKSTATGGNGTPAPTDPAPTTPVGGGNTTTTPTTPVGGGNNTTTPTTPVGGGNTTTPTTPVGGGNNTTTPTTPVGGGDVVDPTTDATTDATTDGVVDPTTGNDAPTTGNNNGGTSESKPADETTPKADDDTTEEKGGSNVVLYIVIAVVAVAAIAAGVFFFLKKKNSAEAAE